MASKKPYPVRTAFLLRWLWVLAAVPLCACLGGSLPGSTPAERRLAAAGDREEVWNGILMLDRPVGYERRIVRPEGDGYRIMREAVLHFRLFGIGKHIRHDTQDLVRSDGRLVSFEHEYELDDNRLYVSGEVIDEQLTVHTTTSAGTDSRMYPLHEPLYSMAATLMYPVWKGLDAGIQHDYSVFDSETLSFEQVRQTVLGRETAEDFGMPAWKIETEIREIQTVSLVTAAGVPLWERSLNGLISSRLETKPAALAYLEQARRDREESLVNYSLVPVDPIANARDSVHLELAIEGLDAWPLAEINDGRQTCTHTDTDTLCRISSLSPHDGNEPTADDLSATTIIPTGHPRLVKLADDITVGLNSDQEKIVSLLHWIDSNIDDTAIDVFNAIDVLERGKGECQGQSFLYASLARTLDIPTRVVNGLIYSEHMSGFLYHTWAESWDGEGWHSVDPVFRQTPVDATHLRLKDGASNRDISALLNLIGQIHMRVVHVENG